MIVTVLEQHEIDMPISKVITSGEFITSRLVLSLPHGEVTPKLRVIPLAHVIGFLSKPQLSNDGLSIEAELVLYDIATMELYSRLNNLTDRPVTCTFDKNELTTGRVRYLFNMY
jgi:hypothetical protein